MNGDPLFDRDYRLVVSYFGLAIEVRPPMQVTFNVTKTIKPEPNKAEIAIYNLSADHRAGVEQQAGAEVELYGGYKKSSSIIYKGQLRSGFSERSGPDWITKLSSGDGEAAIATGRVAKSFATGVTTDTVFKAIAVQIGVSPGNLNQATILIRSRFGGKGNRFPKGAVCYGNAARELTRLCEALNLEWSVQNGKLQILEKGKVLQGTAVHLSASTGLVDPAPTIDNKGIVSCTALMQGDLFPGRQVMIEGERLKARIRVEETVHAGDYRGQSWYVTMKGPKAK